MENELKLNAEIVKELQFTTGNYMSNRNKSHTSDFEVSATIKVGKSEEQITLSLGKVYTSDGYKDYFGFNPRHSRPFASLTKAGIEINYSEVMTQYASMVKTERYTDKLEKRAAEIRMITKAKKEYDESWIHRFEGIISSDKNKRVETAFHNAEFEATNKEQYINRRGSLGLHITYRGFEAYLIMNDGKYQWNGDYVYEVPADFDSETMNKGSFGRKIAEGKIRRAKREGTIFLKYVEAVDYYIANRIRNQAYDIEEARKRESVRLYLEDKTGRPVKLSSTKEYKYRESRYGGGYYYTKHIYSVEGITIQTKFEKEYLGDGKYTEEIRTFSIKGLHGLDEVQFKGILNLLIK